MQKKVLVIGVGRVGRLVTRLLQDCGDYLVTAADSSAPTANRAATGADGEILERVTPAVIDIRAKHAFHEVMVGHDYVISCAPFHLNLGIAEAALAAGVSYLDLTEDVATTKAVVGIAQGSDLAFIPQCGLAPGFISIVAADLANSFEDLHRLKMRVGALPVYPSNRLKYNLTWSTEGLINEYIQPCEAVVDGKLVTVPPLQGLETLSVDGSEYEAFNTSGGLGTLAETLRGRVKNLDYKSIRYPGHRDLMEFLLADLKFAEDRETLIRVFERSLPKTQQDVVIIFVTASGHRDGEFRQRSYVKKIYHRDLFGDRWGGIQITTASSVCAVLDLHAQGRLTQTGFIRQEEVALADFLANRFGKAYA